MSRSRTLSCLLVGCMSLAALDARADDSAYCRKVTARAKADAALLFWPSVQAQGLRFPRDGIVDTGLSTGAGYQFRAALAVAPLDMYKSTQVVDVAEADCRQHEALVAVSQVLEQSGGYGRLGALRRQAEVLAAARASVDALVAKSDERLAAHVITLAEAYEIRSRSLELARREEQIRADIARLEARGGGDVVPKLGSLVDAVDASAMAYEKQEAHVRSLDPWSVTVSGGVIPQSAPVDWFGAVQIGFKFGAFGHNAQDNRYLDARADELKTARYGARQQVQAFVAELRAELTRARRELVLVDERIAWLTSTKESLDHSDAPSAPHAAALVTIDLVSARADRAYDAALVEALSHVEEIGR